MLYLFHQKQMFCWQQQVKQTPSACVWPDFRKATELICNVVPGLSMTWLDSEPKLIESNVSSCAPVFWDGLRISILARSAGTAGHPTWPPHCPTAAAAWAPSAETGAGAHAKVATVERRRVEARACGRGRSAPGHQS